MGASPAVEVSRILRTTFKHSFSRYLPGEVCGIYRVRASKKHARSDGTDRSDRKEVRKKVRCETKVTSFVEIWLSHRKAELSQPCAITLAKLHYMIGVVAPVGLLAQGTRKVCVKPINALV